MILTAHQPVYLPWLGLFHKIWLSETFVSFDIAQYLTKEWMNRNKIKTHSGYEWLNVPVLKKGFLKKKTYEIRINNTINWRRKHFKSLCINYKGAKYYDYFINILEKIYLKKWDFLSELNEYILKIFLTELKIKVNFIKASELNFEGKGSDLVLDMCKKLEAKKYIFGTQGKNYAREKDFSKHNIDIYFQNYNHPKYFQLHSRFLPNLSVIDLFFNEGPNSLEIILKNQDNFGIK
tara:strand:+ start:181 stop:885 length:705 start_codon:yes stop_codon:yes gene_type:complete